MHCVRAFLYLNCNARLLCSHLYVVFSRSSLTNEKILKLQMLLNLDMTEGKKSMRQSFYVQGNFAATNLKWHCITLRLGNCVSVVPLMNVSGQCKQTWVQPNCAELGDNAQM